MTGLDSKQLVEKLSKPSKRLIYTPLGKKITKKKKENNQEKNLAATNDQILLILREEIEN